MDYSIAMALPQSETSLYSLVNTPNFQHYCICISREFDQQITNLWSMMDHDDPDVVGEAWMQLKPILNGINKLRTRILETGHLNRSERNDFSWLVKDGKALIQETESRYGLM